MADVKTFVDQKIGSKRIVVFSKKECPFCTKAKQAFKEYVGAGKTVTDDDYEVIEIGDRSDCQAIQDYMLKLTGGRSVPRCFINQKFIGGGDDVVAKHKNGQLKKLLE